MTYKLMNITIVNRLNFINVFMEKNYSMMIAPTYASHNYKGYACTAKGTTYFNSIKDCLEFCETNFSEEDFWKIQRAIWETV